jgi:hypothetical protein
MWYSIRETTWAGERERGDRERRREAREAAEVAAEKCRHLIR